MNTYVILRRNGWRTPDELQRAAERSKQVGDEEMPDDIRWIRSYVIEEDDGTLGTVSIYQASGPEAIREHASTAGLPADEIIRRGRRRSSRWCSRGARRRSRSPTPSSYVPIPSPRRSSEQRPAGFG